jgi:hypothetical protein
MKYTHKKYYVATWYRIKSDGGCFAGWSLLRCSRKAKGVGGTIKLKRRTIKLSTFCPVLAT